MSDEPSAIHIDCTMAEYHARDEWSNSQIGDLIKSVPLFHGRHIEGIYPIEHKAVYDTGTVAHECLRNINGADGVVRIIPREALNDDGHRKGPAWKQWKAENAGYIDMKPVAFDAIRQMIANVHANPAAQQLVAAALQHEYSIIWACPYTGLPLRARPDLICEHPGGVVLVDFKTTRAVTARQFAKDAKKYGYHRQAAWYTEAAEAIGFVVQGFVFICVDKSPAHECNVYELRERAIQLGREEIYQARRDLAHRLETGDWHAPTWGEVLTLDLPEWAYREDPWRM